MQKTSLEKLHIYFVSNFFQVDKSINTFFIVFFYQLANKTRNFYLQFNYLHNLSVLSVSLLAYSSDQQMAPRSVSQKMSKKCHLRVCKITVFVKSA
jgi:hypothetical protein